MVLACGIVGIEIESPFLSIGEWGAIVASFT